MNRTAAGAVLGCLLLASTLVGCGSPAAKDADTSPGAAEKTQTPPPTQGVPSGGAAEWTPPFTLEGTPFLTFEKDGLRLDLYEVGRTTATRDSFYSDRDTKQNLWPAGSPVVYVNYVLTNTTNAPVFVGSTGPSVGVHAKSMPYLGGLGAFTQFEKDQGAAFGVARDFMTTFPDSLEDRPMLAPGQYAAVGEALPLKTGEAYEYSPRVTVFPSSPAPSDDGKTLYFDAASYTFS
ncbi:MAG: hypothetical protein FWE61_00545 [Micrococcales bacterium]|nr:hypothetical protein [Micrococcales bacterium]